MNKLMYILMILFCVFIILPSHAEEVQKTTISPIIEFRYLTCDQYAYYDYGRVQDYYDNRNLFQVNLGIRFQEYLSKNLSWKFEGNTLTTMNKSDSIYFRPNNQEYDVKLQIKYKDIALNLFHSCSHPVKAWGFQTGLTMDHAMSYIGLQYGK